MNGCGAKYKAFYRFTRNEDEWNEYFFLNDQFK